MMYFVAGLLTLAVGLIGWAGHAVINRKVLTFEMVERSRLAYMCRPAGGFIRYTDAWVSRCPECGEMVMVLESNIPGYLYVIDVEDYRKAMHVESSTPHPCTRVPLDCVIAEAVMLNGGRP